MGTCGDVEARFYFAPDKGDMVGMELQASDDLDPCEIHFSDIREIDGRALPYRWTIRHGDDLFAELTVDAYGIAGGATTKEK